MITNNLLQHYKGYEDLVKHLDSAVLRYQRNAIPIALDFYSMDNLNTAKAFLGQQVPYQLFGGYCDALNKRLVIGEELKEEDYISCLKARFNPRFNSLTHSDLQGAVYNMGIEISKFGDLWVTEDSLYLYTVKELAQSVCDSLTQISRCHVQFEEVEFASQVFHFETHRMVATSLRLDKVVALIIRKSREKAQDLIDGKLVKVNYKTIEDCAFVCNNNDILSIRAFGRFKIDEISTNKSGNYVLIIKKFV